LNTFAGSLLDRVNTPLHATLPVSYQRRLLPVI